MGQGISNLVLVNRTAAVFKATAQLVTINPDTPIGDTVEQEVQPHGTDTLVLTRNQKFDVRVNILFKSSDGATAKIRLNVPPKVITRTIEITESMVFVDGNPSGAVVAANIGYPAASPQEDPSPPVYTEVAEHLKPMAPVGA